MRRWRSLAVVGTGGLGLLLPIVLAPPSHATTAPRTGLHPARATASSCGRWMDASQSPSARAGELLAAMTTAEKLSMVHQYVADGGYFGAAGYVSGIASLCLPPLTLNDAGSGLADEQTDVTSYPAGISLASTWDPALARTVGASLGAEAHAKGIDDLLAPDVDLVRTPLGGRTSEEMGEDPYLAGALAASYVRGVQSQHVIATVKQYAANDQEVDRATIDEQVPVQALAELYDAPFVTAVDQGGAGSVMCAYNQVNGAYSCQNPTILRDDLDAAAHFHGFVVSDWGATHSTLPSVQSGLDMEMDVLQEADNQPISPGGSEVAEGWYGQPLAADVADGTVTMAQLDGMVEPILRSMFAVGVVDHPPAAEPAAYAADVDTPGADRVALEEAEAGTVLLRDRGGVLPLTSVDRTIAVIGAPAGAGAVDYDEAGGSVHVLQSSVSTPLAALTTRAEAAGDTVVYDDGSDPSVAAAVARTASVAVVYAGYLESEGADLGSLAYTEGACELTCVTQPSHADALIAAVAAANPRTVVVLDTGGPALMPWLDRVDGVVESWYPGQEDGAASAAVLFGDVDPAGKLPVTFPTSVGEGPLRSAAQYPGVDGVMTYSEDLLVGYRWYDAEGLTPLFPFGFGLSYTSFAFSGLDATPTPSGLRVTWTLANTGATAGSDVGEVYVHDPAATGQPPQQLEGFARTTLGPGASRRVSVVLPASAFAAYDTASSSWVVEPGCYGIGVGGSSASEPLTTTVAEGGATCPG